MWRKVCTCEFGTAKLMKSRHGIAVVAVAVLWISAVDLCARDGSKDWVVLENCRLITNPANDGDSFHVSVGPNEYIFRLYFVDAPETDEMTPRRLVDQAKYFAITVPQAIEVGRAAKEFTRQKLSGSFTVFLSEQKQQRTTRPAHSIVPASAMQTPNAPIAPNNPAGSSKSHAKEKTPLGRIDVNTATEKELTTVPGIGHVMAARIIAARPFRSADDLKKVSGIGDKKYAQIRPYFQ